MSQAVDLMGVGLNPEVARRIGLSGTSGPVPVTTAGTTLLGLPPIVSTTGAGVGATGSVSVPSGAGFVCQPGEGVVYTTAAGDVDQLWNINVTWAEL